MTSAPASAYDTRVARLRARLADDDLAALLVFDLVNVRYLTGFSGTSGVVLVRPDEVLLFSDFRYRLRATEEAPSARFVEVPRRLTDVLPEALQGLDGVLGVEDGSLSIARWRSLEEHLEGVATRMQGGLVERLRMVKDPEELAAIRRSGALLAETMAALAEMPVVGRPERDIALDLEVFARRRGSGPVPFDFIVAAGPRGAAPHAETTAEPIPPDALLVVDIGVEIDGYVTDMTRTFSTGRLGAEERRIHDLVRRAQERAREAVRPGATCTDVDAVARKMIADAGYGDYFKHGLGHGVGLEVHEDPRLAETSDETLEEGMAVTVEPGIYVPGVGGVRIEDTVVVTAAGCDVVTPMEHGPVSVA